MSVKLQNLPPRIANLRVDSRGFPVPWFVHWNRDGTPDFRIIGEGKFAEAVRMRRCWVCGGRLGKWLAFVIGPMCVLNRISGEPPCHKDCAIFAAKTCPFLTNPGMRRNAVRAMEGERVMHPDHIDRNPGVTAIWITQSYAVLPTGAHYVIEIGEHEEILWF